MGKERPPDSDPLALEGQRLSAMIPAIIYFLQRGVMRISRMPFNPLLTHFIAISDY